MKTVWIFSASARKVKRTPLFSCLAIGGNTGDDGEQALGTPLTFEVKKGSRLPVQGARVEAKGGLRLEPKKLGDPKIYLTGLTGFPGFFLHTLLLYSGRPAQQVF